jgi:hypothetical protein
VAAVAGAPRVGAGVVAAVAGGSGFAVDGRRVTGALPVEAEVLSEDGRAEGFAVVADVGLAVEVVVGAELFIKSMCSENTNFFTLFSNFIRIFLKE